MVNQAIEHLVVERHGDDVWQRVRTRAGCEVEHFIRMDPYPDALTYALVAAASEVLGVSADLLLREFGVFWVGFAQRAGYAELFRAVGSYAAFLAQLDAMHTRLQLSFSGLRAPQFSCTVDSPTVLRVVYRSHRQGLAPFVLGLLEGLGPAFAVVARVEHLQGRPVGEPGAEDHFLVSLGPA